MNLTSRPVGHTRDVGWQVGASRTVDHPIDQVWGFLRSPRGASLWLAKGVHIPPERGAQIDAPDGSVGETRSYRPLDRIRLTWQPPDWDHESTIQVALRSAGSSRTSIRFHQERLADASEREQQREHWKGVLAALAAALDAL
ncbi:MAG: SRPBCC domain-containing protein [Dermatophilaceae bacterium]